VRAMALLALGAMGGVPEAASPATATRDASPLAGTWTLVAAERELPDGRVVEDYGASPHGRLCIDGRGRYALQLYRSERVRFGRDDKAAGTAAEFRDAMLGASVHYGTVDVDAAGGSLVFRIEGAAFPNWEGTIQRRDYTLEGDVLRYRVPPRADGTVPVSVWRRIAP